MVLEVFSNLKASVLCVSGEQLGKVSQAWDTHELKLDDLGFNYQVSVLFIKSWEVDIKNQKTTYKIFYF